MAQAKIALPFTETRPGEKNLVIKKLRWGGEKDDLGLQVGKGSWPAKRLKPGFHQDKKTGEKTRTTVSRLVRWTVS